MIVLRRLILLIGLIATHVLYAEQSNIEFSTDAIMSTPYQADKISKMYVSQNAVRTEYTINGQKVIEIVYPEKGMAIMLNPVLKAYKEIRFNKKPDVISDSKTICESIPNAECKMLGHETIDGRKTEKWQIINYQNGRPVRSLHWIDTKRKLALREFYPDGTVVELSMVDKEKMNGRDTEKWKRVVSHPDGSLKYSFQWYDPKLKIAIKEELPGGYVRELKNIKVAKQKASLFKIPAGYSKLQNSPDSPASRQQR